MNKKLILLLTVLALAFIALIGLGGFREKAKPHQVHLSWQAAPPVDGALVVGYNVYRRTASSDPYVVLALAVKGLTYTDQAVNSGKTYYYVVTGVDQRGRESKYSVEIKAVVP